MKSIFSFAFAFLLSLVCTLQANAIDAKQNRALYAFYDGVSSDQGVKVSWRMRATDDPKTTQYCLYVDGKIYAKYRTKTYVKLASTYKDSTFKLIVKDKAGNVIDGPYETTVGLPNLDIPLSSPKITDPLGGDTVLITYDPQDASAYDMDGDGEQEIILKWNNLAGAKLKCVIKTETSLFKVPASGAATYGKLPVGARMTFIKDTTNQTTGSAFCKVYYKGVNSTGAAVNAEGYVLTKNLTKQYYEPNEFIDCYKLNGKRLWRINMGQNCNVGNNVSFFCWDFDGDGKGEIMLKTAPGTKDGLGNYVGSAKHSDTGEDLPGYADSLKVTYRGSDGLPTYGIYGETNGKSYEWVTVFDGVTGAELGSHDYWPYFNFHTYWDPSGSDGIGYGRRGCDQKGAVIKIPCHDGVVRPTCCFQRGAYTYVHCTDYSWDGNKITEEWRNYSSDRTGTKNCSMRICQGDTTYQDISLYAQGAHPSESSDLDGDGYDELMIGAAAIDHDGKILWSTGLGHGDAVAVGDLNPEHPGLETWRITEVGTKYDACMIDAKTGDVMNGQLLTGGDVARGCVMDIDSTHVGSEYVHNASSYFYDCNGNPLYLKSFSSNTGYPNYRIFWDGDLCDEHFSGTCVSKFSLGTDSVMRNSRYICPGSGSNMLWKYWPVSSINSTKENPCLQCDLLGDWREELVMYTADVSSSTVQSEDGTTDYILRILNTCWGTDKKLPWLRDDNCYNMQIACQNIGYSQPPHLGYNAVEYYKELRANNLIGIDDNNPVQDDDTLFIPKAGRYYYLYAQVQNNAGTLTRTKYVNVKAPTGTATTGTVTSTIATTAPDNVKLQFIPTANEGEYLIKGETGAFVYDGGATSLKTTNDSTLASPYSIYVREGKVRVKAVNSNAATTFFNTTYSSGVYTKTADGVFLTLEIVPLNADVNCDGSVNISDVNAVISVMCGDKTYEATADVNNDGSVNISDVNAVIGTMCGQ